MACYFNIKTENVTAVVFLNRKNEQLA